MSNSLLYICVMHEDPGWLKKRWWNWKVWEKRLNRVCSVPKAVPSKTLHCRVELKHVCISAASTVMLALANLHHVPQLQPGWFSVVVVSHHSSCIEGTHWPRGCSDLWLPRAPSHWLCGGTQEHLSRACSWCIRVTRNHCHSSVFLGWVSLAVLTLCSISLSIHLSPFWGRNSRVLLTLGGSVVCTVAFKLSQDP